MIVVAAERRILENYRQNFEKQMNLLTPIVRKEVGCLRYDTLSSVQEPGLFIILEEWESKKHLDDHLASPHMKEHKAITAPWSEEPLFLSLYVIDTVERIKM